MESEFLSKSEITFIRLQNCLGPLSPQMVNSAFVVASKDYCFIYANLAQVYTSRIAQVSYVIASVGFVGHSCLPRLLRELNVVSRKPVSKFITSA